MRMPLICAICFLSLLCSSVSVFGQQLDIALEGPWIYYVDQHFTGGTALIAMAPNAPGHNPPTFTTGHGGVFSSVFGLYCLGHDGACAFGQQNNASLLKGSYAAHQLLPVQTLSNWNWYTWTTVEQQQAWYVVLPMPDSVSNDGVDYMTLQGNFGVPATVNGANEYKHSIGLHLHYANWPSTTLTLFRCSAPTGSNCVIVPGSGMDQEHNGTLRISMSAVEEADPKSISAVCDYHVRAAYHSMILLLDNTSLESTGTPNKNKSIGYVDLRRANPDAYDDETCLLCDPQNPVQTCPTMQMLRDYTPKTAKDLLGTVVNDLTSGHFDETAKKQLQAEALTGQSSDWPADRFPQLSHFTQLENTLELSFKGLQSLYEKALDDQAKVRNSTTNKSPLVQSLEKLRDDERELIAYIKPHLLHAATSGKDCRVAQMLIP
jgi:hypothetical protein